MILLSPNHKKSGHGDLSIEICLDPYYSASADSYYLFDFLNIDEANAFNGENAELSSQAIALIALIEYWQNLIVGLTDSQSVFLPFDLSDQYIQGLLLQRRQDSIEINVALSQNIAGWGSEIVTFQSEIVEKQIEWEKEDGFEWKMSISELLSSLDFNINKLKTNAA